MKLCRAAALIAFKLSLLAAVANVSVAHASSSDTSRPANGLVLFEGFPNIAEFVTNDASLGPDDPLYDLWVVDPIGGVARNLTNAPGVDAQGEWSPDGLRVAFTSNRAGSHSGDYEIYLMDADGRDLKRLTNSDAPSTSPVWSPDGRRLAFIRGSELWMMRPDGESQKMIYRQREGRQMWLADWSPDGRSLLLEVDGGTDSGFDLWTVSPDGSGPRRLIGGSTNEWAGGFSPDGRQIVFSRGTVCEPLVTQWCLHDLFVVGRDGSGPRNITNTPHMSEEIPTWSPDGEWIAYTGDVGTARFETDLWVIDLEGRVRRPLAVQPRTWDVGAEWQSVDA